MIVTVKFMEQKILDAFAKLRKVIITSSYYVIINFVMSLSPSVLHSSSFIPARVFMACTEK